MASDKDVKFTEADLKSFTKKQENANMKKESSHDSKQFKEFLAKYTKGERFEKFLEIPAAEMQDLEFTY